MARPATGQVVERHGKRGPTLRCASAPTANGSTSRLARERADGRERRPSKSWQTRSRSSAKGSGGRRCWNLRRPRPTTRRSICSHPSGWRRSGTRASSSAPSSTTSGRSPTTSSRSSRGTGCRRSRCERSTGTSTRRHAKACSPPHRQQDAHAASANPGGRGRVRDAPGEPRERQTPEAQGHKAAASVRAARAADGAP